MTNQPPKEPTHDQEPAAGAQESFVTPEALAPELGSSALIEARQHVAADEEFTVAIVDTAEGDPAMRIHDGVIELDRQAHVAELASVHAWLLDGIANGDTTVLAVFLRNVVGEDDDAVQLRGKLQAAFDTRDAAKLELEELSVGIVSAGIAERNMIRNGLRPELAKQPVYFRGKEGQILAGENDLDIIIAKGDKKSDTFKLIVGSKTGIETVHIPQQLNPDQFVPVYDKITKDDIRNVITVPIKAAAGKTKPSVSTIEVYLGAVDLPDVLAEQDRAAEREKKRVEAEYRRRTPPGQATVIPAGVYNPPAPSPSPGRWSNYSG